MIYFVQDSATGLVKIGFAADPWRRLTQMQTGCPGALAIIALEHGDLDREAALHRTFAAQRVRGEWFDPERGLALIAHIRMLPKIERPAGRSYRNTWGDSGLTDLQVSRLVGMSRPQLSRVRRGKCDPGLRVALRISRVTGLSLDDLAALTEADDTALPQAA